MNNWTSNRGKAFFRQLSPQKVLANTFVTLYNVVKGARGGISLPRARREVCHDTRKQTQSGIGSAAFGYSAIGIQLLHVP